MEVSFSKEVKDELLAQMNPARHCRIAELAALLSICARAVPADGGCHLRIHMDRPEAADKCRRLIESLFDDAQLSGAAGPDGFVVADPALVSRIMGAAKLRIQEEEGGGFGLLADHLVVQNTCCKRAFIRGAFLCAGSVSDPAKAYHFELDLQEESRARQMKDIINSFMIDAKMISRRRYYVVYVKEGSQIVDLLNIMEAHKALMKFENVRILKEVRNSVNRQVNCEAANINKTVTASSRQIDDIILIRDRVGFEHLSEGLEEIARLRTEYPEATLKELGAMLNPPIGKSGVNHRLRKLGEIAEGYRD